MNFWINITKRSKMSHTRCFKSWTRDHQSVTFQYTYFRYEIMGVTESLLSVLILYSNWKGMSMLNRTRLNAFRTFRARRITNRARLNHIFIGFIFVVQKGYWKTCLLELHLKINIKKISFGFEFLCWFAFAKDKKF